MDSDRKTMAQSGIGSLKTKNLMQILTSLSFLRSKMDTQLSELNPFLGSEGAICSNKFSFLTASQHVVVAVFSDELWEEHG